MIQPEDILRKAQSIYGQYLRAWLEGETGFFPRLVPAQRYPGHDVAVAIDMVRRLREGSKEVLGYGYTIEWRKIRSRRHGHNPFPQRILFASEQDLLRFVKKELEFKGFVKAVTRLRTEFSGLDGWIRSNIQTLIGAASEVEGLVHVVRFLCDNPRPNLFARELPLPVDTKFIERNKGILRQWLDRVLPPHAISADEEHFDRRFGLRYVEPHLFLRFLDPALQNEFGCPCAVISVPLHTVGTWPAARITAIVVENRVNLLTLPPFPRAVAIGGLGDGASLLGYISWLRHARLIYWGDLDTDGLEILSSVRALFPQVESIFMNEDAYERFRHLTIHLPARTRDRPQPPHLTESEQSAFALCASENVRLEQERIPQADVVSSFGDVAKTLEGSARQLGRG